MKNTLFVLIFNRTYCFALMIHSLNHKNNQVLLQWILLCQIAYNESMMCVIKWQFIYIWQQQWWGWWYHSRFVYFYLQSICSIIYFAMSGLLWHYFWLVYEKTNTYFIIRNVEWIKGINFHDAIRYIKCIK